MDVKKICFKSTNLIVHFIECAIVKLLTWTVLQPGLLKMTSRFPNQAHTKKFKLNAQQWQGKLYSETCVSAKGGVGKMHSDDLGGLAPTPILELHA